MNLMPKKNHNDFFLLKIRIFMIILSVQKTQNVFFENNLNYYDFFTNRKIGRKKIIIIIIFKKQFMIFSLKNMIF